MKPSEWFFAIVASIIFVLSLTYCQSPRAEDLWGVASLHSYHRDREAHYNENNLGVGLEYKDWCFGEYYNSEDHHSVYLAKKLTLSHSWWDIRFGALAGVITGYRKKSLALPLPMAMPGAFYEPKNTDLGINILWVPSVVVGIQVKWRF